MADKTGADDFIADGGDLEALLESASGDLPPSPGLSSRRQSLATYLVDLADEHGILLFHDASSQGWASLTDNNRRITLPLPGQSAERWLRKLVHRKAKIAINAQSLKDAIDLLVASAVFDGPELPVFIRTAFVDDALYIDLGDQTGSAIRVDRRGWEIFRLPQVHFFRPADSRPLPTPVRGGDIEELREFVNIDPADFNLFITALAAILHPPGPYVAMVLTGQAGSAKSTTARIVRALTDPGEPELSGPPRDEDALVVSASHRLLVVVDNLSHVTASMSDAYCRITTGGGTQKRRLFTDNDVASASVKNPVVITAIGNVVTRGDLNDRALTFDLPPICPSQRQTEDAFWQKFNAVAPSIFGALLDVLVQVLKTIKAVKPSRLPRMADFARFGYAAAPALGWTGEEFLDALDSNRGAGEKAIIDDDLVAQAIIKLMEDRPIWEGTSSQLLTDLRPEFNWSERPNEWPTGPRQMSDAFKRLTPLMTKAGLKLSERKSQTTRRDRLKRIERIERIERMGGEELASKSSNSSAD